MAGPFPGYFPRYPSEGGNPWQSGANAYSQELGQLQGLQQQGYAQDAMGPQSIYDRFIQGYQQQRAQQMQDQQFQTDQAFKQAQIGHLGMQTQQGQFGLQDAQRKADEQRMYDNAYQNAFDPSTGQLDENKLYGEIAKSGFGSYIPQAQAEIYKNKKSGADILRAKLESTNAAKTEIAKMVGAGMQSGQDLPSILKSLDGLRQSNPDLYNGPVSDILSRLPEGVTMMPPETQGKLLKLWGTGLIGSTLSPDKLLPKAEIKDVGGRTQAYNINPLTGDVAPGTMLGTTASSSVGKAAQDIQNGVISPDQGNALIRKETYIAPNQTIIQQAMAKDPRYDALWDTLADRAFTEGRLPQEFVRNQAAMLEIGARLAEKYPGAQLAQNGAVYKANSASLTGMTKMTDNLTAFEKTAAGNWQRFEGAVGKLGNQHPLLDAPINRISKDALGDPNVSAAVAAGQSALTEYSRIINNPNLIGELPVTTRQEIFSVFPNGKVENATLRQVQAVGKIFKADAQQRLSSNQGQLGEIRNRISGGGGGTAALADDRVRVRNAQGQVGTIPRAQLESAKAQGFSEVQ